jgi:SAM-dependent methyltransferase
MVKNKDYSLFEPIVDKIKFLVKLVLLQLAKNELLWKIVGMYIVKAGQFIKQNHYLEIEKKEYRNGKINNKSKNIFSDLIVRHGIFKGMRYPDCKSIGSLLYPKLLGSYENEIRPILEKLCYENYTEIVNIGCGTGYYAVGLAMRIPNANVYAYDIDKEALKLCDKMACLNGVKQRLTTYTYCDADALKKILFRGRALIVSDCEGYEKYLFTEDIIPFLVRHDLIIEVHDFIDIEISSIIYQRFDKTHDILIIESIDDMQKVKKYAKEDFYEDIKLYDLKTRKALLSEERPSIMEWLYLRSKNR